MRLLQRLRLDARTLVSGILVVLAFPPWDFSFLIWFALVPWIWALDDSKSLKQTFFHTYWLGALMTLGGFPWVAGSVHEFGELPWAVSYLALILFTLICQPQFWLFAPAYHFAKSFKDQFKLWQFALIIALIYVFTDGIIPKLFVDTIGNSLYTFSNIRQIAEISGVATLTFLVILQNWVSAPLIKNALKKTSISKEQKLSQAIVIGLLCVVWIFGFARKNQIQSEYEKGEHFNFALIQANIGNFEKVASESGFYQGGNKIVQKFFKLSEQALQHQPKPDFIVWPETAYPSAFRVPRTNYELVRDQKIETFAHTRQIPILFGGYDSKDRKDYNAFHFLRPKLEQKPSSSGSYQGDLDTYHKFLLLPFAEYFPGSDLFPWILDYLPQVANFGLGKGPVVHTIKTMDHRELRIGPEICYEVLKQWFVREQVRKGAQAILNITNDSWFGDHIEPYQHLALASIRTIENRVPLIRSTNTGITTLVDPVGNIIKPTQTRSEAVYHANVKVLQDTPWTLYRAFGNWLFWVGGIALFALIYLRKTKSK